MLFWKRTLDLPQWVEIVSTRKFYVNTRAEKDGHRKIGTTFAFEKEMAFGEFFYW